MPARISTVHRASVGNRTLIHPLRDSFIYSDLKIIRGSGSSGEAFPYRASLGSLFYSVVFALEGCTTCYGNGRATPANRSRHRPHPLAY